MPFLSRQLTPLKPVPSDLAIAQSFEPVNIVDVATSAGILPEELTQFGTEFAKVKLDIIKRLADRKNGKYVVVTAMNPTPLGEGKSTTTIGLAQALGAHLGKNCIACIRQPSQGPTFSVKGGAAGGGYSQVIPMDKFNLHLTGDIHAIAAANNLLAAAIDTRIYHEKTQSDEALYRRLTNELKDFTPTMLTRLRKLGIDKSDPKALTPEERVKFARLNIDPATITWNRVVDVNDRVMRSITIGEGPLEKGCARKAKFEITVASELMAILALSADLADMRRRFGDIVVAKNTAGESVTAEDIGCAGAMAVLMKDAIEPTLMQTLEATPVLVHAGPFANIAQGNSSIVADRIALKLVGEDGIVLTEAGFGADMGCEKFFDIKCRESGLHPNAAVIVATVRALKFHGGIDPSKAAEPHEEALREGTKNLLRHIENTTKFGIPSVVVLNRFTTDTDEELALVTELCKSSGAFEVVVSEHWARGGAGAVAAAEAVERACNQPSSFKLLYPNEMSLVDKIRTVCKEIYRADDVVFEGDVLEKLADFERRGFGNFPVCMAKTQYSFSANPDLKGAPLGFSINIKDVRANCGARFVFPYCGDISTMPGLPTRPGYYLMDIDLETGKIVGLS